MNEHRRRSTEDYTRKERGEPANRLPMDEYRKEARELLGRHSAMIVIGETGCGKTTRMPPMLRDFLNPGEKIAITEPRRVAAVSVAKHVADEVGCEVGTEVGYQVRFDAVRSPETTLNFMTDGLLLQIMRKDPLLREFSIVMVDEAHERSINIDIVLGLLKQIQARRENKKLSPLKIVVASATLEKSKFTRYFEGAPVLEVPGRLHPVDVHYREDLMRLHENNYMRAAASCADEIVRSGSAGDVIIFMPGEAEIRDTVQLIEDLNLPNTAVLSLFGQMAPEDQDRVFDRRPQRRIIVATNIAETSVTIDGVTHVIDTGLIKQKQFDPSTGIEGIELVRHSRSGCIQRTGRAGRTAPGNSWRLYSQDEFEGRPQFSTPEIQRSNLAHVVLTMKGLGIENLEDFEFIDPPSPEALAQAVQTLQVLGALDEEGHITETGNEMAELPLEPRLARTIVEAKKRDCVEPVCTIAACASTPKSLFARPKGKEVEAGIAQQSLKIPGSDFLTLLNVYREWEDNDFSAAWAREHFLNTRALFEAREIRRQLLQILRGNGEIPARPSNHAEEIQKTITVGLLENLLRSNGLRFSRIVDQGYEEEVLIDRSSVLYRTLARLLVAREITAGGTRLFARMCQKVEPEWVAELAPHLIEQEAGPIEWDRIAGHAVQTVSFYLQGGLPLKTGIREIAGEEGARLLANALAFEITDSRGLPFVAHNRKILAFCSELYRRSGGSTRSFTHKDLADWYKQRLGIISSVRELQQKISEGSLDLALLMDDIIPKNEKDKLLWQYPDSIVIDGREYAIEYRQRMAQGQIIPAVRLSPETILALTRIPKLLSGAEVTVEVEGDHYFTSPDLDTLKTRAKILVDELVRKREAEEKARRQEAAIRRLTKEIAITMAEIFNDKLLSRLFQSGDDRRWLKGVTTTWATRVTSTFVGHERGKRSISDVRNAQQFMSEVHTKITQALLVEAVKRTQELLGLGQGEAGRLREALLPVMEEMAFGKIPLSAFDNKIEEVVERLTA